ncbi:adenylate/guanylate cyclase domain-containing protein [Ferrovibrio sp.]|uniref:adenylate/guanylate cyclase domain-containing protein n=1 Tax=Ferrovibrio sp. TaxID=1917215 RepID=UPI0035B3CB9A
MSDVIYDVYTFTDYRWQLVKQFQGRHQKQAAIDFAEHVYREKHIIAFRVIEETHDAESGEIRERKILNRKKVDQLPNKKPPAPKLAARTAQPRSTSTSAAAASDGPTTTAEAAPLSSRGKQAIMMLLAAMALGAVALLFVLLDMMGTVTLGKGTLGSMGVAFAVAATAGLALLATAPDERGMIMRVLSQLLSERETGPSQAAAPPAQPAAPPQPQQPALEPEFEPLEPDAPAQPDLVHLDADDPDSAVTPERHASLLGVVNGFVTLARGWIAKLLQTPGAAEENRLTRHMSFGIHLFLAGLCEQAAKLKQWALHEQKFVLAESLGQVFGDAPSARRFAGNFQEYLAEPRYMEMYQSGLSWNGQLEDGMPAGPALVERWVNKTDGKPVDNVTVMFTDIIGSTEFTQRHGDKLQMELVQAHDRIVRQAVEDHRGRWVKHTGDGAMLAFQSPLEAVRAAVQIQSEVRVHNEIMPLLPLKLRVGLSTGKPIKAGEDLFGSTVQLAARVCALADVGQIVVSEAVTAACQGAGFSFVHMGSRSLKGFPEAQTVYGINLG